MFASRSAFQPYFASWLVSLRTLARDPTDVFS
jgi:hypothetical protein